MIPGDFDLDFDDLESITIAMTLKDGRIVSKNYTPDELALIIGEAVEKQLQKVASAA